MVTKALGAVVLGALALGCGCSSGNPTGPTRLSETETINFTTKINNKLDLLFVIDDQSSTSEVQSKLYDQLPLFMNVLESAPSPPDLHVAVVTTDMGAPGDSTASLGCTTSGDAGAFRSAPTGTCADTSLTNGATYLAVDGNGVANFTTPLATTLQCISLVGNKGCGFDQPLAALDRALGADGSVPPAANSGFLRPDAYLGIIVLSNEDDCSAPANTQLFSLNGGQQNLANALGPIARYRCNQFGHLCKDPSGALVEPPLVPPSNATGSTPTLDLTDCVSNDINGLLTPVSQFISDIKALKPDPDNQIIVAAIVAPATPYTVAWVPEQEGQNTQPGELWPEVEHSCGQAGGVDVNPEATMLPTDGSFGDPAVRLSQFVNGFTQSTLASICGASYAPAMQAIATQVSDLAGRLPCLTGAIQLNAQGLPDCSVIAHLTGSNGTLTETAYQNCALTGNAPPCWSLGLDQTSCTGQTVNVVDATGATSQSATITCSLCAPGVTEPGC